MSVVVVWPDACRRVKPELVTLSAATLQLGLVVAHLMINSPTTTTVARTALLYLDPRKGFVQSVAIIEHWYSGSSKREIKHFVV